jgi:hypothetical protein
MCPETYSPEQEGQALSQDATSAGQADAQARALLASWGFSAQEIASLLWLRRWYQSAESDRASAVSYLKFLRLLVQTGELEL